MSSTYSLDLDTTLRAYTPAWETVGHTTPATITQSNIAEVRRATGLTWEPAIEPVFRRSLAGGTDIDPLYVYEEPRKGKNALHQYVTRGEGGNILDITKGTYHLFSNRELFDVAEALGLAGIEAGREIKFVAGGEMEGGSKVFLLADLGVRTIPGDPSPHASYMGLLSGHDGSAALKVIGTDLRWSCTNMIKAAEIGAKANGTAWTFRHTSRMATRVDAAKKAIAKTLYQIDDVDRLTRELLAVKVTPALGTEYIRQFALSRVISKGDALRRGEAELSHQRATALAKTTQALTDILASRTCDGIRDTGYGLYAAAVEFFDNVRPARSGEEGRLGRTLFTREPGKNLALDTLHALI